MSRRKKPQVLTMGAIKGGTGKTATAVSLAHAALLDGKKPLLIDLDPQCSASVWLRSDWTHPGSYELLTGSATAEETIQETGRVFLITGSANLAAVQTAPGSAKRLEAALQPILTQFDLILIDTAPAMGELQNNALYASTGLVIPVVAGAASLQGLYQITDIAKHIQESKPALKIIGTVVTQYDRRPNFARFMLDTIKEKGAEIGAPFLTTIRNGIAVREAEAMQDSLFNYAPKSKPAEDYLTLYKMIMA